MERMTRKKDEWECRFLGNCPAEDWVEMVTGTYPSDWECSPCDCCPFEKYINYIATVEDKLEEIEKHCKSVSESYAEQLKKTWYPEDK